MAVTDLRPGQGVRPDGTAAHKARQPYSLPNDCVGGRRAAASAAAVAPALAAAPSLAPNPKPAPTAVKLPQPRLAFLGTVLFGGLLALAGAPHRSDGEVVKGAGPCAGENMLLRVP